MTSGTPVVLSGLADDADALGVAGSPAAFDPSRDRLRATPRHLAALAQLLATGAVTDNLAEDLAALKAAGVITVDGLLPDRVADMVAVFAAPSILVHVETTSGLAVVSHVVAVRHRTAWTCEGFPGTAISDIAPLDPLLLVPALARMVNLLPDPAPPSSSGTPAETSAGFSGADTENQSRLREPIQIPAELLDGAWTALAVAGPAARLRAVKVARDAIARLAPDVDATDLDRLADVLVHHRLAWRITTSWKATPARLAPSADVARTASDIELRSLAVIDAGPAGLWRRDEPEEPLNDPPGPDTRITLTPVTTSQVWHAIADLLPGRRAKNQEAMGRRIPAVS